MGQMTETPLDGNALRRVSALAWGSLATGTLLTFFGALCIGLPAMISSLAGLPQEQMFVVGVGSIVLGALAELPFVFALARGARQQAEQDPVNPPIVR